MLNIKMSWYTNIFINLNAFNLFVWGDSDVPKNFLDRLNNQKSIIIDISAYITFALLCVRFSPKLFHQFMYTYQKLGGY
jgi:hypothetical protein